MTMTRTVHDACIVDGRLCRLVEEEGGLFSAETWAPKRRRWVEGGVTPVAIFTMGMVPTPEQLQRLGLTKVPK